MNELFGVLNLDKPAGITSRRAIDAVAKLVRPTKVGHAGTLDPLATGVLVTCIGRATRLIEYIQDLPKQYSATFLLGRTSSTEDVEGEIVELHDAPRPTLDEIRDAASAMIGEILQRPPAFSALKVAGQRAYALARRGDDVQLTPRPVMIYRLEIVEYDYPSLALDIKCGSGTYVRSLGRDLAESLGTGAIMSSLVRTAIGHFRIEDAINPASLSRESIEAWLITAANAVKHLPTVVMSPAQTQRLEHGKPLVDLRSQAGGPLAALNDSGRLVAILRAISADEFRSERFFPTNGE
jgi:tRNA pseudouridine55 synthase